MKTLEKRIEFWSDRKESLERKLKAEKKKYTAFSNAVWRKQREVDLARSALQDPHNSVHWGKNYKERVLSSTMARHAELSRMETKCGSRIWNIQKRLREVNARIDLLRRLV